MSFLALALVALVLQRSTDAFVVRVVDTYLPRMAPLSASSDEYASYSGVRGVIFDVDGTLADSWKLGYDATQEVLKNNNINVITEEMYHEGTKYSTPERLARHAGLTPDDDDYLAVGQRLGDEFDNLYVDLVSLDTAQFYDGISPLLTSIPKDVAVGALTNACVDYAHAVLKTNCPVEGNDVGTAIYTRFASIRGADNVPTPKPSPDGLIEVCKDLHVNPQDCVYVGDSPTDALAAKAAGMGAIGVLWGSHAEENVRAAPFDYVCRTVEELQALMPREQGAVLEKG